MRIAAALAAAVVLACGGADAPEPSDGARVVRLATWNVHDLFDEVDRAAPPGAQDLVPTHAEVEAKLARVGAVVGTLDADVVALQEVENLDLLRRLAQGPLAGLGYDAFLVEGGDPRGIDVGVLSRVPVLRWVSHLGDRAADGAPLFARDLAEVHLGVGRAEVVLVAAHLVSRLDPSKDGRRREQAARARAVVDALAGSPARPLVVLMGDLNDLADGWPLAPLLADRGLADLGATLGPAGWTWAGGGRRERIDYALVPRAQASTVASVQVVAGTEVEAASDHRPLVVDLWLGPAGASQPSGGQTTSGLARYDLWIP
ncbi:MAG TPA: endonuclease/exonuclease/phosphatase family protein [Anaeromyxobacteraceae bacterium]|nr:endonuclease/exonuclease/phosphatase family protein [Anaeromyxobacteraceae bacterium]